VKLYTLFINRFSKQAFFFISTILLDNHKKYNLCQQQIVECREMVLHIFINC